MSHLMVPQVKGDCDHDMYCPGNVMVGDQLLVVEIACEQVDLSKCYPEEPVECKWRQHRGQGAADWCLDLEGRQKILVLSRAAWGAPPNLSIRVLISVEKPVAK
ncbi:hypothetical protein WISP_133319 [Willisornis vidua]|uniref:Uncharacterized protein n=1 Tax=Willisornis vidua TaxID=1566151 RepID=A0ABQ9CUU0_9PASS|nr:hypothetical protein WISP_133319 [Willisornis vidua]